MCTFPLIESVLSPLLCSPVRPGVESRAREMELNKAYFIYIACNLTMPAGVHVGPTIALTLILLAGRYEDFY